MNRSPGPTARTRTRSPDGPCESRRSCSRAPSSSVGVGIWPTLRTLSAVCRGSSRLSWPGPAALQRVAVPGVRGVLGKRLGIEDTAGDGHRHSSDVGWCRIGWSAWRSWSKTPLRHAFATANVWSSVRSPHLSDCRLVANGFHERPRVAMTNSVRINNSGRDSTRPPGPATDRYRNLHT